MTSAPEDPRDHAERPDTQRLAREAHAGDAQRFGELYERVAPALYTWAALRIRPAMRGALDPEDVVQEVWSRAWKGFAQFDPDDVSFRAWIFRIAKNVLLEGFRKLQRAGPAAGGPTTRAFQLANLPDSATAISRRVARHEGIQQLLAWIDALEEDEKKLFVHCGLEGLSYAEVGERMQLQKDAVAKRWQGLRARAAQFGVPRDLIVAE